MAKFKKVGGGSYGLYKKQEPEWPYVVGGIVILLIVIGLFAG